MCSICYYFECTSLMPLKENKVERRFIKAERERIETVKSKSQDDYADFFSCGYMAIYLRYHDRHLHSTANFALLRREIKNK